VSLLSWSDSALSDVKQSIAGLPIRIIPFAVAIDDAGGDAVTAYPVDAAS